MYIEKNVYLCANFLYAHLYTHARTVTKSKYIGYVCMALAMCFFVPVFSYAQAQHIALGTNVSNAPAVADTVSATVTDGEENYFKIEAAHLPATVYYMSDSVFGPIPTLISVIGDDTLSALMVVKDCRMGWKWELEAAGEEEAVRYLYFSSHENGATAEIQPFMCQPTFSETAEEACDSLEWNGTWYAQSGNYTFQTINAAGCDSTATLHLTVHPSYHITLDPVVACDFYQWGDTTIEESGTYTRYFKSIHGCDSVVRLTVDIRYASADTWHYITAYDSYTWINGVTYTYSFSGGPSWEMTNIAGCDSIINLNLTIRHMAVVDTIRETVCLAAGESYSWRGMTYAASGVYTTDTLHGPKVNEIWQDSLHTLDLTINRSYTADTTVSVCATEYTWRGTTYTQSGNYPYNGKTKALCDSIVTLHLTLKQATASEQTVKAYDSYKWNGTTYTESGDYTFRTTNAAGCDSVATLHLTIEPRPVDFDTIVEYFCPKSGIIEHVDTTANPRISFLAYRYEKPRAEVYMEGVISGETSAGANVDFGRVYANLDAFYVAPLTPVEFISWRYMPQGGQYEPIEVGAETKWMNVGTISMDVVFRCGYRHYGAFTVGRMTEGVEAMKASEQPIKRIENGQVVIIRGGVKYSIFGLKIEE